MPTLRETFWVIKRKSDGLYRSEMTVYDHDGAHHVHTPELDVAGRWHARPATGFEGYALLRVTVYEEEEEI